VVRPELAPHFARLIGWLIDIFVSIIYTYPVIRSTGLMEDVLAGKVTYMQSLLFSIYVTVMYLVVNGYLLTHYGQTIGKRLAKTRIVSIHDDKILPFSQIVLLRILPVQLINLIPVISLFGFLADSLFVFREDRRCIHDLIAGSKVINA
jgi:uncharacterized RDD family membrane protein YckC